MSPVLEGLLLPGRAMEGLRRWLPVLSGLAVMYVPTYVDLARGPWQEEAHAHGPSMNRSSGADGRDWMAVDGQVIADHRGPNIGVNGARLNRIILPTYTDAPAPGYQWMDNLEVWDGFPPDAGDRPYRPGTGAPRSSRQ